jgi:hypothetical protein
VHWGASQAPAEDGTWEAAQSAPAVGQRGLLRHAASVSISRRPSGSDSVSCSEESASEEPSHIHKYSTNQKYTGAPLELTIILLFPCHRIIVNSRSGTVSTRRERRRSQLNSDDRLRLGHSDLKEGENEFWYPEAYSAGDGRVVVWRAGLIARAPGPVNAARLTVVSPSGVL